MKNETVVDTLAVALSETDVERIGDTHTHADWHDRKCGNTKI